jgi:hypothetical protein
VQRRSGVSIASGARVEFEPNGRGMTAMAPTVRARSWCHNATTVLVAGRGPDASPVSTMPADERI